MDKETAIIFRGDRPPIPTTIPPLAQHGVLALASLLPDQGVQKKARLSTD
jgi:hypothetical protein